MLPGPVFEELERGRALREHILEILRDGPRSISQVVAALKARGYKLHRLAVAGYLKALADADLLDEREIPPAKVYGVKPGPGARDLYTRVGEQCREHASLADAGRLCVQVLSDLMRRPVFKEELRRAGFESVPLAEEVAGEERGVARRFLARSTLKLPFNDPAFRPAYRDPEEQDRWRELSRAVLGAMVREEYHAGALAVTTKQATLGGGD